MDMLPHEKIVVEQTIKAMLEKQQWLLIGFCLEDNQMKPWIKGVGWPIHASDFVMNWIQANMPTAETSKGLLIPGQRPISSSKAHQINITNEHRPFDVADAFQSVLNRMGIVVKRNDGVDKRTYEIISKPRAE